MSVLTKGKIQVSLLTFNRAAFLRESLESLANQSARGFKISVFDNASSDSTPEVVEAFRAKYPDIDFLYYRHPENVGSDANFAKAVECAECEYVMIMHDDDVLHPRYIEFVADAVDSVGNVALVSSNYKYMEIPAEYKFPGRAISRSVYVFDTYADLAAFSCYDGRLSFSAAVYRTSDLRKYRTRNVCGKIGDTPVLIETARGGRSVVFADKNFFLYRVHCGQDSKNKSNGPFDGEIFLRDKFSRDILMSPDSKPFYKYIYRISRAEWLYRWKKFSGADALALRKFMRSIPASEVGGLLCRLYSLPAVGRFVRLALTILRYERKIHWRKVKI